MRKFLLTIVTMIVGVSAYCQMGPFKPLGPVLPPPANSGYAYSSQIVDGTCTVLCLDNPDHICMRKVTVGMGRQGVEIFDAQGKSVLKVSYTSGQYRTDPTAKKTEFDLFDAVKL